jgi:hypothetical protein
MEAHTDADRTAAELVLGLGRGTHGPLCFRKRNEEGISLGVDLHAAVSVERVTQDTPVSGERSRIPLRAELVQELRGSLDVGE